MTRAERHAVYAAVTLYAAVGTVGALLALGLVVAAAIGAGAL